jgi:hypothetical protein
MYFDGQLSYLDKDKKPSAMPENGRAQSHRPTTDETGQSSQEVPIVPSLQPPPPAPLQSIALSKSQSVAGAAGDLHSMALKSAISNIGTFTIVSAEQLAPHFVKRPSLQKRMLSAANPTELIRTTLSPADISFRAITYLPDELLYDIPETGDSALTLFQGFKATLPESSTSTALRRGNKSHSHHRKSGAKPHSESHSEAHRLQRERESLLHDLEVLTIRKVLAIFEVSYCRVLHRQKSTRLTKRFRSSIVCVMSFSTN